MIDPLAVQWLLTVVFAVAGLATALTRRRAATPGGPATLTRRGAATPGGPADRISAVFCPVMCAALIAMIWWSEPAAAVWLQVAGFGGAAIWFAAAGILRAGRVWPVVAGGRSPGPGATGQPWRLHPADLHHALMGGVMIWMLAAMPAGAMPGGAVMPSGGSGPGAMPGMSPGGIPAPVVAVGVLLAVCCGLAAVPWLVRAIGPGLRAGKLAAAGQAMMTAGMAALLIVML